MVTKIIKLKDYPEGDLDSLIKICEALDELLLSFFCFVQGEERDVIEKLGIEKDHPFYQDVYVLAKALWPINGHFLYKLIAIQKELSD